MKKQLKKYFYNYAFLFFKIAIYFHMYVNFNIKIDYTY